VIIFEELTNDSMNERRPNRGFIIFILGALDTIAPLTIDMYLPAFSRIAHDFGTTTARVSLSLTSYFIGLGIGQVFYGPLLDRYGRHQPLYWGIVLYVISSVGCAMSRSVEMLIAFRFTQALGGASAAVAVRAMVRDYFPIQESPKIFSMLMLILSVSPLFAPSIGGVITIRLEWYWVFYILATIVIVIGLLMYFYLPETYEPDKGVSIRVRPMLNTFISILKNVQFTTYTLATSFSAGGLFIYLAGSTVILQDMFKVSPQFYAVLFALQSVGLILGNQLNIYLLRFYSSKSIFQLALTVQMVSALIYLIGTLMDWYGIYSTISFFFVLLACLGMTFPNGSATALAPFSQNLGSASALMGFLQISIGGLISASIGLFNAKNSLPVATMILFTAVSAWAILITGEKIRANQRLEPT
jgi:DHA1 family bicyclomycin/chloramphenicol resistance-like MFS transporter